MHTVFGHLLASFLLVATFAPVAPTSTAWAHDGGGDVSGDHHGDGEDFDDHDGDHCHGDECGNEDDGDGDGGSMNADAVCDSARCAVLAEVSTSCPCTGTNHGKFVECVQKVIHRLADQRRIPRFCTGRIVSCAANSICGRPGAVVCSEPKFGICDLRHSRCVGNPSQFCTSYKGCPLPPKCDVESSSRHCLAENGVVVPSRQDCCGVCGGSTTTTTSTTSSTATSRTTTTSTTSTTSSTAPLCGNGVINPGEQCDPPGSATCPGGSAGGAFGGSASGAICLANCTCPTVTVTSTSSTSTSSTTSTSTSTSTSTTAPLCGNGVLDPGEQCDPPGSATCPGGSAGGGMVGGSASGAICLADCTCPSVTSSTSTSTSSSTSSSTSTSTSSSTSTTAPLCGNGLLDAGEDCDPPGSATCPDPSSPSGALLCGADCTCPTVSTTSSSTSSTSSTSSSSTTSSSTSSTTSTTIGSAAGALVLAPTPKLPPRWQWLADLLHGHHHH